MTRKMSLALIVALMCMLAMPLVAAAETGNVLTNGSFEGEFDGGVGEGWTPFNNGGLAGYTYVDESWERAVYDGDHSQMLVIQTRAVGGSEKDRYNGIYQTAKVVPGQRYMFSFYGMVRTTEGTVDKSGYGYRVEIAFDQDGGTDPWAADLEWREMDKWPESPLRDPGSFQGYARGVTATSDELTVFIRVWKKWATPNKECWVNVDAVSLLGSIPAGEAVTTTETESGETMPETGVGLVLQVVGGAMGVAAIGLTGARLKRRHG